LQLIKGLKNKEFTNVHLILFNDIIKYKDAYNMDISIHILGRKHKADLSVSLKLFKLIWQYKPDIVLSWTIMSTFWLNFIRLFVRFHYLCAYVSNTTPFAGFSFRNLVVKHSFFVAYTIIGNSQAGLNVYKVPLK